MPTAYFSKIHRDTSWSSLLKASQLQKARNCKPLHYNTLVELSIPSPDFDILGKSLAKANQCYLEYTSQSIADMHGLWNCIVIGSKTDDRKIALYTAGRTFPLYAAADIE